MKVEGRATGWSPMPKRRLRKYEYTVNTEEYLEGMKKCMLEMDKKFTALIKIYYSKIEKVCNQQGLDALGRAYVFKRLDEQDLVPSISKATQRLMNDFMRARYYDNDLFLWNYHPTLKGHSDKDLKADYGVLSDKVIKTLSVTALILGLKAKSHYLKLSVKHCRPYVVDRKSCNYFRLDILKALAEFDYRIKDHRVSKMFNSLFAAI